MYSTYFALRIQLSNSIVLNLLATPNSAALSGGLFELQIHLWWEMSSISESAVAESVHKICGCCAAPLHTCPGVASPPSVCPPQAFCAALFASLCRFQIAQFQHSPSLLAVSAQTMLSTDRKANRNALVLCFLIYKEAAFQLYICYLAD